MRFRKIYIIWASNDVGSAFELDRAMFDRKGCSTRYDIGLMSFLVLQPVTSLYQVQGRYLMEALLGVCVFPRQVKS